MVKSTALLSVCALANKSGEGCAWCGGELPKRRRTWCGDRCANAFWTNHWWTLARRAAKRRDRYRCKRCGERAPKRGSAEWRALRKTKRVEVNHIVQAQGAHVRLSCLHHLTNLETLCVSCHKAQTKLQAAARRSAS
jgi:5-methylcytosine-specific restriction endonuclease McrA